MALRTSHPTIEISDRSLFTPLTPALTSTPALTLNKSSEKQSIGSGCILTNYSSKTWESHSIYLGVVFMLGLERVYCSNFLLPEVMKKGIVDLIDMIDIIR